MRSTGMGIIRIQTPSTTMIRHPEDYPLLQVPNSLLRIAGLYYLFNLLRLATMNRVLNWRREIFLKAKDLQKCLSRLKMTRYRQDILWTLIKTLYPRDCDR